MIRYLLMKESLFTESGHKYTSFGIQVVRLTTDGFKTLGSVSDISTDEKTVQTLVQRCNAGDLDPIHLPDVVSDFLNAQAPAPARRILPASRSKD